MPDHDGAIFDFELDFAGTLRCIPMVVRYKLDRCGVKLSLRQWSRFDRGDRAQLVDQPCDSDGEAGAYRDYLVALIAARAEDVPELVPADAAPAWSDSERVPERIVTWAGGVGVDAPTRDQWAQLSPLQRFALYKLTRPGHANDNFVPAMREFGLVAAEVEGLPTARRRRSRRDGGRGAPRE